MRGAMKNHFLPAGTLSPVSDPEVQSGEDEPPGTIAGTAGSVSLDHSTVRAPGPASFRARCFPGVTDAQWNDWRWQLRNRVRDLAGLERVIELSPDERAALDGTRARLPLSITPYYAGLLDPRDPRQPLRRSVVPQAAELARGRGEADDPLGEDADSPVPGLVHRYPDRVLFLVTGSCSVYCRYCTRSRAVGGKRDCYGPSNWETALGYIASHRRVRDVLLSGGDPLTLPGERLEWLLGRLRAIPHVEIVRIGTKVPAVLPQRVTSAL
ncbi:KamA family radical SAM protein, partial [candidate division WOR-3 bacterium]|nr:KamA family radical SAM protein [candidate division WOR-3 bacterium]